jgi:hypothetical protein
VFQVQTTDRVYAADKIGRSINVQPIAGVSDIFAAVIDFEDRWNKYERLHFEKEVKRNGKQVHLMISPMRVMLFDPRCFTELPLQGTITNVYENPYAPRLDRRILKERFQAYLDIWRANFHIRLASRLMTFSNIDHTVTVKVNLQIIHGTKAVKDCSRLRIRPTVPNEENRVAKKKALTDATRLMGIILEYCGGCDECRNTYCFRCCPLKGDVDIIDPAQTPVDIQVRDALIWSCCSIL